MITAEAADLYQEGIIPDAYQCIVNLLSFTGNMLRCHDENEDLKCTHERIVEAIKKLSLSYESVETFMNMLGASDRGSPPI